MHSGSSEERATNSASASPRMPHKTSSSFFGFLTKRSPKVEPHPLGAGNAPTDSGEHLLRPSSACGAYDASSKEHDMSFAKCSPDRKISPQPQAMNNHVSSDLHNAKSRTLPGAVAGAHLTNNNIEKSYSSGGLLGLHRKAKPKKGQGHLHRHSTDGSQSDSAAAGAEVVLRNSPKHRSPNHNRFSHQFSLCCKAEKKPMTPPVTVRYNSIPDATNNLLRRDNQSLSWSLVDNASSSMHSSSATTNSCVQLSTAMGPLTLNPSSTAITECASAPESPVTGKMMFTSSNAHSSPSNSSLKSAQSETSPNGGIGTGTATGTGTGPIRPIALSACRSRLRLKLYPPGKEVNDTDGGGVDAAKGVDGDGGAENDDRDGNGESAAAAVSFKRVTTPQHMSSPNIASQPEIMVEPQEQDGFRFMSHENIQMQRQSSSSGLARQALLSAQVLSLIPTEKARERSFLDGRLGSSSLFGPSELNRVLPSKEVTIFVGTWNMNGQNPPKQMNDFVLPVTVEHVPDIVAIGTQESSPDRFEWEVTIQETLGPSHVLFYAATLGTLHLAIYMRRDLIWYCSAPEDASLSVRTGTAFRTKGAVAISFCLFGTSMLFVTSHLTAHQQKVKERVSDVKRITHALDLPKNLNMRHKSKDVTQNFDNVFWGGDLNFRLSEPREKLLEWIQNTKFPLPSHLPHGYMHTDQLSSVLSDGAAFRGFMEANITFPPTYKYDPGTQHFDTSSKQRAPAYTDRILYKYRQSQGLMMRRYSSVPGVSTPTQPFVQCLMYDSVPSITTSDHKPVWALFKTQIRAGTDSIPLAAGLFNRDIYLEGMKRRLNNKYSGSSAVCTIQ